VRVARVARPAVVQVAATTLSPTQWLLPVPGQAGVGTGVLVDRRGYVLTNSHVVRAGGAIPAPVTSVTLDDGRTLRAAVVDDDPLTDLAVLKIGGGPFPAAALGDWAAAVGEPVVAIGRALALPGGPTVTTGVVSALGRAVEEPNGAVLANLIQTDAAVGGAVTPTCTSSRRPCAISRSTYSVRNVTVWTVKRSAAQMV
jgi:S1-C subfamily serine protease